MACHPGPYLGVSMFARLGTIEAWPNLDDHGRGELTHAVADDMVFKVPSLRNVAMTSPYFHDGSAATLEEAVQMMAKHQTGLELSSAEIASIVVWLKSLTAPLP